MKKYFLNLPLLLILIISCQSSQKLQRTRDAKEDAVFNSWINHSKSQLINQWGQPDSSMSDGKGGQILIYKEGVDYKSVMNGKYTGPQFSFRKEMYINADSSIYSWRAKRKK